MPAASPASPSASPQPGVAVVPGGVGPGNGGSPNDPGGAGAPGPGDPAGQPPRPAAAGPFSNDSLPGLVVLGLTMSTIASVAIAWFVVARRRRRDDDQEAPLTHAPALAVTAPVAAPFSAPLPFAVDPGTGGTDVDMPRWRRPSLMAARKSDPIRSTAAAASLTFAQAPGGRATRGERRLVRYRIVRLFDQPDELIGTTVGSLDEGDEVEVLETRGMYRRVQAPDGRTGWLHKMTLGDLIEAPEPEPEIEKDVLMAYLAGRGKG